LPIVGCHKVIIPYNAVSTVKVAILVFAVL